MDRTGPGTGPEVGRRFPLTGRNAGTVSRTVRQIARRQPFRQACGRSRDIERRPMERIGSRFVRGILNIVKNHGVGLEILGSATRICAQVPVELERRRLVVAAGGVFRGNLPAVGPCGGCYPKHPAGACANSAIEDETATIAQSKDRCITCIRTSLPFALSSLYNTVSF